MASYHLGVKTQLSEEWLRNFNSFYEELKTTGCQINPDGTLDATTQEIKSVMDLAKKNHISIYLNLIKL